MANLTPLILNNVASTVQAGSSAIGSATATGVNVASGDGASFGTIGTNQFIPAVIVDTSTSPETVKEYVWITARSTDALTVVRQAEESTRYAASTTSIQSGYTIAAAGSAQGLNGAYGARGTFQPRDYSYFAWSFDPLIAASGTFAQNTAGALFCNRVVVPASISVSNIVMFLTTGGSGLTSGQCFAGIYSSTGTRLAVTADQSTAFAGSSGYLSMALTGAPITIAGGLDQWVYVATLYNGTTGPTFRAAASAAALLQTFNGATIDRFQRTGTGNTSLPTTQPALASASFTSVPWVALS